MLAPPQYKLGPLPPFNSYNWIERRYVLNALNRPLSGYLGGVHQPGYWVDRLSAEWASTFKVGAAIPCNSATSGLLAACIAAGIKPGDEVWCPVYTMSATASCAKMLGADVRFFDIEPHRFSMNSVHFPEAPYQFPKAVIVTNLFGHPAYLEEIRAWCDRNTVVMIEDNAQAPFARINGRYTGTIGHMGVFSLNVHKHIQCGEGGVVVTNDPDRSLRIKDAINHGELRDQGIMGLNLRMTETTAAIACAQLAKGPEIVRDRRELAHEMTDMVKGIPWISPPIEHPGCQHVYYQWAARVWGWRRKQLLEFLNGQGLPMRCGYSPLLSKVFATGGDFHQAEKMEYEELITFEVCSYSPTKRHKKVMREIFKRAGDKFQ